MQIGEALRLLRVYNDLKSNQLAEALELSPSYVSEIENGKKQPSLVIVKKYADYFRTTPSAIMLMAEGIGNNPSSFKAKIANKLVSFLHDLEKSNA